ncbi:hypothetical protein KACHI17_18890 [Sediminibacterium sp. KACHI17]|uniref:Uncharacterized protein n=1 Tax=Sediminibacterium sp. KACHI17 TaxID=1751071 RepID=A0AAT9GK05_9BACT
MNALSNAQNTTGIISNKSACKETTTNKISATILYPINPVAKKHKPDTSNTIAVAIKN